MHVGVRDFWDGALVGSGSVGRGLTLSKTERRVLLRGSAYAVMSWHDSEMAVTFRGRSSACLVFRHWRS